MDWQLVIALSIVAVAFVLWLRLIFTKKKSGCGGCPSNCQQNPAPQNDLVSLQLTPPKSSHPS